MSKHSRTLVVLTAVGFVSGLLTGVVSYASGSFEFVRPVGGLFGLLVSACLAAFGVFTGLWQLVRFSVVAIVSFLLAFLVSVAVQMPLNAIIDIVNPYSHPPAGNPIALFVGGGVGGFLIFIDFFYEIGARGSHLVRRAFFWCLLSGGLGSLGWALGPSLGMRLWSLGRSAHLVASMETRQNALTGGAANILSLYLIWQTGTAFLLGLTLYRYHTNAPLGEAERRR